MPDIGTDDFCGSRYRCVCWIRSSQWIPARRTLLERWESPPEDCRATIPLASGSRQQALVSERLDRYRAYLDFAKSGRTVPLAIVLMITLVFPSKSAVP